MCKACRCGQDVQLFFRPNQYGEEHLIVGARQGGFSITETVHLLGFSHTKVFAENGKQKTSSEQQVLRAKTH